MYANLLKRQMKRYLDNDNVATLEELKDFLDAINRSYEHYERDHFLAKQSLEISSDELRQLIDEIADKEVYIRAILDATSDGLLVINEKQEIELSNHTAATYLGFVHSDELIGRNASTFKFTPVETNKDEEYNLPAIRTLSDIFSFENKNFLCQLTITQQSGNQLPIEVNVSKLNLHNRQVTICLLRDVSLRKQSEKKIRLRHEITRMLFEATSLQNSFPQILSCLSSSLKADIIFLWLRDKEGCILPSFNSQTSDTLAVNEVKKNSENKKLSQLEEKTIIRKCLNHHQYYIKNRDYLLENIMVKSHIVFPIFLKNHLFGLIELYFIDKHSDDEQEIKILQDISSEIGLFLERQEGQQREYELQKQLLLTARQAGMMQVATSVLHNVGNILNSVNISASLIHESLCSLEFKYFIKVASLIKEHKDNLTAFITEDEKGKNLPVYFLSLADWIESEQKKLRREVNQLISNINNIKNVIKRQQSMSVVIGLTEKFSVSRLVDDIIVMKARQLSNHGIIIETDYKSSLEVELDRSKLFQILENLIGNAIDALKKSKLPRKLIIHIDNAKGDSVDIRIIDNGCGIPEKDLESIFSFGFTTKGKDGHGFGLHSSALLAKEIGGKLSVTSEGLGKGATFTLSIPLVTQ